MEMVYGYTQNARHEHRIAGLLPRFRNNRNNQTVKIGLTHHFFTDRETC
jgi:hypothetical protein